MHSIFSKSKFLVTILTSSNVEITYLCYESILNQLNHPMNYDIIIVVNSLDANFLEEIKLKFKDIDVNIIQTESNGKPGKGHNSLFEIFENQKQYDYLIPIDGDDFLYPYALHQLSKIIEKSLPDLLVLQGNDILSWFNDSTSSADIYLNHCFYLIKQDEYPDNKWRFNKDVVEKNSFNSNIFITPIRLILCNRKIFNLNIDKYYCEKCKVLDDYLFFLHFVRISLKSQLNAFIINSNHIYLYNDLSIQSVHNVYNLEQDYDYIKEYNADFDNIKNILLNNWNILELPYLNILPPYENDIFKDYDIIDNSIQIKNYNKYLNNINTVLSINFAKKICIKIYEIFKINIDVWLSNGIVDKAYTLSSKLIDNNICDKEIYSFICVCGVILKNELLIKKYINNAKPYCRTYKCLDNY